MKLSYKVTGNSATTGSLHVTVRANDRNSYDVKLHNFHGNKRFDFYSYGLSRRDCPELFTCRALQVEISIEGNTGTAWIDEVQLEAGNNPTPFVEGTRLPHDAMLEVARSNAGI